ncbi:MAG TPA: nucleotidyltransferase family protein [Oculatellaceae cyanobacterium]
MSNIAIVILAAGSSKRMGQPKQKLNIGGKTFLQNAIDVASLTSCSVVLVVVQSLEAADAFKIPTNVRLLVNADYAAGMATSIKVAVNVLESYENIDALMIMNCDQPRISTPDLQQLIDVYKPGCIVASTFGGTIGSPALFDRRFFPELQLLQGDRGAKSVILQNKSRLIEVSMPGAQVDVDTREDYEALFPQILE